MGPSDAFCSSFGSSHAQIEVLWISLETILSGYMRNQAMARHSCCQTSWCSEESYQPKLHIVSHACMFCKLCTRPCCCAVLYCVVGGPCTFAIGGAQGLCVPFWSIQWECWLNDAWQVAKLAQKLLSLPFSQQPIECSTMAFDVAL